MPSTSQKQHDFMLKACKSEAFAKRVNIDQKVACEFIEADAKAGLWQSESVTEDEIGLFLERLPEKTQKNLQVIHQAEAKQPFMLHLSLEKKPTFTPRIGFKQAETEDRTTPRITVADTLIGCLIGYAVLMKNIIDRQTFQPLKDIPFNNGLYIHKLPFEYALKPNNKLVYDASKTNEHWLVAYNKDTATYPSERIGDIFVNSLMIRPTSEALPLITYELYLDLKESIWLTDTVFLEAGYHALIYTESKTSSFKQKKDIEVVKIDKSHFQSRKTSVAAMLSAEQPPIYSTW